MANVLEDLEAGWEVFELFAHLDADPATNLAATRARLLLIGQVVVDLDSFKLLGKLLSAVLVAILNPTRDEWLARFFLDTRLVDRQFIDHLAEKQQLPRIERLGSRPVVPAQDCRHGRLHRFIDRRLMRRFQLINLPSRFFANTCNDRIALLASCAMMVLRCSSSSR